MEISLFWGVPILRHFRVSPTASSRKEYPWLAKRLCHKCNYDSLNKSERKCRFIADFQNVFIIPLTAAVYGKHVSLKAMDTFVFGMPV